MNMEEFPSNDTPNEKPVPSDPSQMSEFSTVINVFFEPGRVFEDLKRKPRFIIGAVIIALCATVYGLTLSYKVGEAGVRRAIVEQIESNPRAASLSPEQKAAQVDLSVKIQGYTKYAIPVFVFITFLIGGLFYFLGAKAFGGNGGFMHALSVWIYSSIPPAVVGMVANMIVLLFKSVDEIDLTASQRGLIHANPGLFMDGKAMPVLTTIVSTIDLFAIWGWVLAAIGLRITNKLSSGSAWAVVIIITLIGLLFRVFFSFLNGAPMYNEGFWVRLEGGQGLLFSFISQ